MMKGEQGAAIAAARDSVAKCPRSLCGYNWSDAARNAAAILAWSGAQDEAADLLEQLSTGNGGLAPAYITRDPRYSVPLADNARYKALVKRLEAQMAATKLE